MIWGPAVRIIEREDAVPKSSHVVPSYSGTGNHMVDEGEPGFIRWFWPIPQCWKAIGISRRFFDRSWLAYSQFPSIYFLDKVQFSCNLGSPWTFRHLYFNQLMHQSAKTMNHRPNGRIRPYSRNQRILLRSIYPNGNVT